MATRKQLLIMANAPTRDIKVATICVSIAAGMLGLAFASVPLYRLFCQVTGYGGTTMRVTAGSATVLDRTINVRFDANVSGGLPWTFEAPAKTITVKLGETAVINYRATSTAAVATTGSATYNVVPDQAGSFFNKLACFCFVEQRLEPGQSIEMPVQFFVDPALATDKDGTRINDITLSYTFYPVAAAKRGVAETPTAAKPRS